MSKELTSIEDILTTICDCSTFVDSISAIHKRPGCDGEIEEIIDIVGVLDYVAPNGKHICELPKAENLLRNDLFLISQLSVDNEKYESKKLTYASLKDQLLNDLMGAFNLKTMAYENKNFYALTSHNHDALYNLGEWHPNPRYNVNDKTVISNLALLHISTEYLTSTDVSSNPSDSSIEVETLSVNCPVVKLNLPPEPLIGTIKFIASKSIQNLIDSNQLVINETSLNVIPYNSDDIIRSDFDGWVFPNGQTFQNVNEQLSDAAQIFAGNSKATQFTIPNLSGFFFCCRYDNSDLQLTIMPPIVGLKKHIHTIGETELNCDLEIDNERTCLSNCADYGQPPYVHQGNGTDGDTIKVEDVNCVIAERNLFGIPLDSTSQNEDKEPKPKHNIIPVMMYIGGVKREFYENLPD